MICSLLFYYHIYYCFIKEPWCCFSSWDFALIFWSWQEWGKNLIVRLQYINPWIIHNTQGKSRIQYYCYYIQPCMPKCFANFLGQLCRPAQCRFRPADLLQKHKSFDNQCWWALTNGSKPLVTINQWQGCQCIMVPDIARQTNWTRMGNGSGHFRI